jgi:hypothetical protein
VGISEIKEYIQDLRDKADRFEQSGWAVDGLIKDFRRSADIIEALIEDVIEDL